MKSPFYSGFRVTQAFGINPNYYKKFGLKAHEGIDIVPITNNWTLLSLTDGVVVKDEDNPRSGAYGVYLTIWDDKNNIAFQYCHMEKNTLKVGDRVTKGQAIGRMGATGNVTGAHLHLNMFQVDDKGIRLNRDNGYLGGIDPLPFLEGDDDMDCNEERKERDLNWKTANVMADRLNSPLDPKEKIDSASVAAKQIDRIADAQGLPSDSSIDTIVNSINGTKGEAEKTRKELKTEKEKNELHFEKISKLEVQSAKYQTERDDALKAKTTEEVKRAEQEKTNTTLHQELIECKNNRVPKGFFAKLSWLFT